jgi:hypothetical protein
VEATLQTGISAAAPANQINFLDAALRSGRHISLDVLLPLEWELPPPDADDDDDGPWSDGRLTFAGRLLMRHNPGLLSTAAEMERAKYGAAWPSDDAPLHEHVGRYLLHIRGKWGYFVWSKRQQAPTFTKFLADYVGDRLDPPIGCYLANEPAAQLLRLATGQPRFLATKTTRRK